MSLLRAEMNILHVLSTRSLFRTVVVRRLMRAELNVCSTHLANVESLVVLTYCNLSLLRADVHVMSTRTPGEN